jgi:tRNA (guanine-N7-)-methyltransferase
LNAKASNLSGTPVERRIEFEALGAARRLELKREVAGLLDELGSPGKLTLELGCGHGHFLSRYAEDHPAETCFGVDFSRDRIRRAARKQGRAGLDKLRFVYGEIREYLAVLPPGLSVSRVFVLYPDPWPKRRHHKYRLMNEGFLDQLADRSEPGCQLYFRTDSDDYFEKTGALISVHKQWEMRPDHKWSYEYSTVFQERTGRSRSLVAIRR